MALHVPTRDAADEQFATKTSQEWNIDSPEVTSVTLFDEAHMQMLVDQMYFSAVDPFAALKVPTFVFFMYACHHASVSLMCVPPHALDCVVKISEGVSWACTSVGTFLKAQLRLINSCGCLSFLLSSTLDMERAEQAYLKRRRYRALDVFMEIDKDRSKHIDIHEFTRFVKCAAYTSATQIMTMDNAQRNAKEIEFYGCCTCLFMFFGVSLKC